MKYLKYYRNFLFKHWQKVFAFVVAEFTLPKGAKQVLQLQAGRCVIPAVLLLTAFCAPAFAIDPDAGTSGAAFMKIGAGSPRAQGMGRAYVALAEGPEAMVWNPAGIAASQLREIHFSYLNWLQDYSGQYLGYVHPYGQTVFGANIGYFTITGFDVRDEFGVPQDNSSVKVRNGFGTFTVARSFFVERLFLGTSVKGIMEDNAGTRYDSTVFDLGALLKIGRKLSLGWSVLNLGGNTEDVVRLRKMGAAYNVSSLLTVSFEKETPSDNRNRTAFGFEINLPEELIQVGKVSLRTGIFTADNTGESQDDGIVKRLHLDKTAGVTLGFGILSSEVFGYTMAFDYAMVPYGALGKASQMGLRFQF